MNTTTETGKAAAALVEEGLEVSAEIALEEKELEQGVDQAVLEVVKRHGLRSVLASIQCAACTAAEVHEDTDEPEDLRAFRARVLMIRLGEAIDCLK